MKNIEKTAYTIFVGLTFPILFGILAIAAWFDFDQAEGRVLFYLVAGILIGIMVDIRYLGKWIKQLYTLPVWFAGWIYLVYNILAFGFFMGVPVFNLLLGPIAGYYSAKRLLHKKISPEFHSRAIKQVSLFTGFIMVMICLSSAYIALKDATTGNNIQGMLGLDFTVTRPIIWGIILLGGTLLTGLQILLTGWTMAKTLKKNLAQLE